METSEAERKPRTAWQLLKPDLDWIGRGVSWKALIVVFAAIGIFGAAFVLIGGVNISADRPDGWLVRNGLHLVFKRSIANSAERGDLAKPADFDAPSRVKLGAQHFDMVCANCHGVPGKGQSVTALSMSPRPQYLPNVIGQFSDNELHFIVAHGVKFSAMPSWATGDRGDEVWSLVAFLRQLPKMDGKAYAALTALPVATGIAGADAKPDAPLVPANAANIEPPKDEFSYAAPAHGFFDPSIASNPAATCARCHSVDGTGAATGGEAPNLTIQDASYLRKSLEAYVGGTRKSGYMQTVAAQLSQAQIAALADHYAGLPVRTVSNPQGDAALMAKGEAIATQGLPGRAIAACANCHDSAGTKISNAPHIAGQSDVYLRRQLDALRQYGRGSVLPWNPMRAEAHQLADGEIAALAAFYAAQKPIKGGGGPLAPATVKAGDVAAAREIFETRCLKCHLNDARGDSGGSIPNLTIQSPHYAAQQLYSFRTGARVSNRMREVTESLTLDQLASLAAYVGSLSPQGGVPKVDAAAATRGQAIAQNGAAARGVPACLSCHDGKANAALTLIPNLQGQSVVYLNEKLAQFAQPEGAEMTSLNPMPAIASKLNESERGDLAAYFAAQPPVGK